MFTISSKKVERVVGEMEIPAIISSDIDCNSNYFQQFLSINVHAAELSFSGSWL